MRAGPRDMLQALGCTSSSPPASVSAGGVLCCAAGCGLGWQRRAVCYAHLFELQETTAAAAGAADSTLCVLTCWPSCPENHSHANQPVGGFIA
jgi:hypothetical protein